MRNADAYTVSINEATKRFEVHTEGEDSYIDFRWYEDRLVLLYIYVPPLFRGKGVSQSLIEFALQTAREKNLKVQVYCPYIAKYIRMHSQHHDLMA